MVDPLLAQGRFERRGGAWKARPKRCRAPQNQRAEGRGLASWKDFLALKEADVRLRSGGMITRCLGTQDGHFWC